MIGFAGFLRNGFVLRSRNDTFVGVIMICVKRGLLAIYRGNVRPQLLCTVATTIPNVKGNDLTCLGVHGDPELLFVTLLRHKAPHLIGLSFQPLHHHISWTCWEL